MHHEPCTPYHNCFVHHCYLMNQSTWLTNQSFAGDIQSLSQYWHLNFNYLTFTVGFIPSEPCTTHTGEWSNQISAHSLWHTCPFEGTLINICRGNTWKAEMYCAIKPILGNISTSRSGDFLLTKYIDISMQTVAITVVLLAVMLRILLSWQTMHNDAYVLTNMYH